MHISIRTRSSKFISTVAIAVSVLATTAFGSGAARAQGIELTVTSETLNVRSGPTTGDNIVGSLKCGQKVTADAKTSDGAWYQVSFNGGKGFVFAQFAQAGGTCATGAPAAAPAAPAAQVAAPAPAAPAAAPATGGNNFTVTSEFLNVRSQPSTSGSLLGRLNKGDVVQATAKTQDGAWLQINYKTGKAFVSAQFTTAGGTAVQAQAVAAAAPAAKAPAVAAAAPPKTGGWTFELGGHVKETDVLGAMKGIGMNWVKVQDVNGSGNPHDISGIVGAVHGAGMKILIGAIGDRGRAADAAYHDEFARNVAALASQGADAIEVWNEPNLDREYGGSGNGQVNPENYADMLRKAYGAIKSVNPNTLVVSGAPAPTGYYGGGCSNAGCDDAPFLQRLAATGAADWMDCIGAHHNGTMVGPDTTSGAPVGSSGHSGWYFWGTLGVAYNPFGGKRPVCWTELGYVTGEGIGPLPGGFSWGNSITLDNQAQWLARAAQLSRESGKVRFMIIWNMNFRQFDDDPQSGFSIFRPNGGCPACNTLKAVMGA